MGDHCTLNNLSGKWCTKDGTCKTHNCHHFEEDLINCTCTKTLRSEYTEGKKNGDKCYSFGKAGNWCEAISVCKTYDCNEYEIDLDKCECGDSFTSEEMENQTTLTILL